MRLWKKATALLLAICLVCSVCVFHVAALEKVANRDITLQTGTNRLTLTDANVISVMQFIPGEAGVYRFSLIGTGCQLYTVNGSFYYMFGESAVANNQFEKEIKESVANSPILIGIAGKGNASLKIERVGDASFDINALPYETYQPTATLTKFTKPAGMVLSYVDVTTPHTAVLDGEGNYRLDSVNGPKLYIDLATAPYVPIAAAASNGNMKAVLYKEDGTFDKKIEFITCINKYYGYTDNSTNRPVAGYTDGGIYPLTYDMIYIMQTYSEASGWNDYDSLNYLFKDDTTGEKLVVDKETAWMFPVCYDANDVPAPSLQLGDAIGKPGDTVTVTFTLDFAAPLKAVALSGITYDADSLELIGGEWADLGGILSDWDGNKKNAVIAFTENTDINGEIFSLTFRIKDAALYGSALPVSCDIVAKAATDGGEETMDVTVKDGTIRIPVRGDLNDDAVITAEDAVYLLYYTMLPEQYPLNQSCDYVANGTVDSDDAIYLLYHSLLPALYPLA